MPGHRYTGPGNPVPDTLPVDGGERTSALRDLRYHKAFSADDIRVADGEAIQLFAGFQELERTWSYRCIGHRY